MHADIMPNWLQKRADLTPNRIALKFHEEEWTFAQLNIAAIRTAKRIGSLGIKKGDHVAVLLQNGTHTVEIIHALQYLGAITVFLNTRLSPYELSWQLGDSNAGLLIFDANNREKAIEVSQIESTPTIQKLAWNEIGDLTETEIPLQTECNLSSIHSIIYTSGTTGHPKGVMLSYGNHWWSATGSMLNMGLQLDDRWLACVPFFHVSGLSILMRSVIYGITVIIHETFDPHKVNQAIQEEGVSIISVVSNMLSRMLDQLQEDRYPKTFRSMLVGGGPVPLHLLENCKNRNIPVYQTYGMTETASQIVTLGPEYMLTKLGSAGKPLFPAELRIVVDGKQMSRGEVGEIVVRGANVTRGYYHRPDASSQSIQNGWLYTGDLGYLDDDGFLYVVDRRSDLIISGGENVYPAEIEAVLTSHPSVSEAGVTGTPDPNWGQVPIGFVKLYEGQNPSVEDLLAYCRNRLATYKVPKTIYFVDEIPRNAANKVLRRKLTEMYLSK